MSDVDPLYLFPGQRFEGERARELYGVAAQTLEGRSMSCRTFKPNDLRAI